MIVPKPHILSLHPTMQCDYHCPGCYLKRDEIRTRAEREPQFFEQLIRVGKKLGMKEIAVPANYTDVFKSKSTSIDLNLAYFLGLKNVAIEEGMEFSSTANYDFVEMYIDNIPGLLNGVSLMSVSVNDFSTATPHKKSKALETLRKIKLKVPRVNCNVLVTPTTAELLKNGMMDEVLASADTVYLLVQKPLVKSLDAIKEWLSKIEGFFDMVDDKVILDSCLKSAFGLTDGVCSRHHTIYINPYGEVKQCSYDAKTIFTLERAEDLETLYHESYPQAQIFDCTLINNLENQ